MSIPGWWSYRLRGVGAGLEPVTFKRPWSRPFLIWRTGDDAADFAVPDLFEYEWVAEMSAADSERYAQLQRQAAPHREALDKINGELDEIKGRIGIGEFA